MYCNKIKLLIPALLAVYICFARTGADKKEFRYTNPITRDTAISMRDHFIIKTDNKWYFLGTSEPGWTGLNPGVMFLFVKGKNIIDNQ
jgi:hypothetical protein